MENFSVYSAKYDRLIFILCYLASKRNLLMYYIIGLKAIIKTVIQNTECGDSINLNENLTWLILYGKFINSVLGNRFYR